MTITPQLESLLAGRNMTFDEAGELLDAVFDGEVPEAQVAAFLTALQIKGVTAPEIAGLAASLRNHAVRVDVGRDGLVDTCGTGGARHKTFNISTAAAFVAAGAGASVAKHGNRGITSKCGSADVLTALGVNVSPGPEVVADCIRKARIGFMFAPSYHPAMKYVQPVRRALGFRTVFNILGPLANPAGATAQVMGVPDPSLMRQIIETLMLLGVRRAMVVHSDGLDEISTMGPTQVLRLADGRIDEMTIQPGDFGLRTAAFDALRGDDPETNAAIIRDILDNRDAGPRKDIVVFNAAAAIIVAGLADGFPDAIRLAEKSIESGAARAALDKMIEISNTVAG